MDEFSDDAIFIEDEGTLFIFDNDDMFIYN